MDYRYTRHQVARGTRADAEGFDKIHLIKKVSVLRATYQIKLLAFKACQSRKKLILRVPTNYRFDPSLRELMKTVPETICRENL